MPKKITGQRTLNKKSKNTKNSESDSDSDFEGILDSPDNNNNKIINNNNQMIKNIDPLLYDPSYGQTVTGLNKFGQLFGDSNIDQYKNIPKMPYQEMLNQNMQQMPQMTNQIMQEMPQMTNQIMPQMTNQIMQEMPQMTYQNIPQMQNQEMFGDNFINNHMLHGQMPAGHPLNSIQQNSSLKNLALIGGNNKVSIKKF